MKKQTPKGQEHYGEVQISHEMEQAISSLNIEL